jgi:hypothetical protein
MLVVAVLVVGSPCFADGLRLTLDLDAGAGQAQSPTTVQNSRAAGLEKAGRRYRGLGIALTVVAVAATVAGGLFLLARDYSGGFGGAPSAQQRDQADTFATLAEASFLTAGGASVVGAISWATGGQMLGDAERLRDTRPTAALSWTWRF